MLRTVADILRELQRFEQQQLSVQKIVHAPTIGAMYEGLSRRILSEMVPKDLGLKLVEGFVSGPTGELSRQVDCMLVKGEGQRVPYTECFVWPIQDVLAVFEIKKSLYSAELRSSHTALSSVLSQFSLYLAEHGISDKSSGMRFIELTGRPPLDNVVDHAIRSYFAYDNYAPIRVVFAYDGFSTETALRVGFMDHFLEYLYPQRPIISPNQFPNLIVCGNNSIVRFNGHPYLVAMDKDEFWPLLASSSANPLCFVIEKLWYRFATDFGVPYPFESELIEARKTPLLAIKMLAAPDGLLAIHYSRINASQSAMKDGLFSWQPIKLTPPEWKLLRVVQIAGVIKANDPRLTCWLQANGVDLTKSIDRLVSQRLIVNDGGALVCSRTVLYTTVCQGEIFTALEQDKDRLDSFAKRQDSQTTKRLKRKSAKVMLKLERAIDSWHRISNENIRAGNSGLGTIRIVR